MNEKYLWELWNKCKHPHPKFGGGEMVWPIEFAELIIRECVDTVTDRCEMRNESDVKRAEYYAGRIKDHFGLQ